MNTETWIKKRIKQCAAELKYWESREGNLAENQAHFWRGEIRYYKTAQQNVHPTCGESAPLQALSTPEADTIAGHLSTPPTSG